jgi:hypothetical protein
MRMYGTDVEEAREAGGLVIVSLWLGVLAWKTRAGVRVARARRP